jgi:hypothetical protein
MADEVESHIGGREARWRKRKRTRSRWRKRKNTNSRWRKRKRTK